MLLVYSKTRKIYLFYDFPGVIKHINSRSVIAHAQNYTNNTTKSFKPEQQKEAASANKTENDMSLFGTSQK